MTKGGSITSLSINKVNNALVNKILEKYFEDFRVTDFKVIERGYENISIITTVNKHKYVIRIYNRYQFSEYKRTRQSVVWELDFIEHMSKKGIPVPKIIHTLNSQQLTGIKVDRYSYLVILTEYIRGRHLRRLTNQQLKEIIHYQALMHKHAKSFKTKHKRGNMNQFGFEKWVLKYHQQKIAKETKHKQLLIDLKNMVAELYPKVLSLVRGYKKVAIHNDVHRENLKFLNGKISGIFDFDDALMGVPCVELGKTIFFIGKKSAEPKILDKNIDKILNYYSKINTLTRIDREVVRLAFMLSWAAHNFFFFDGKPLAVKTSKDCLKYYKYFKIQNSTI